MAAAAGSIFAVGSLIVVGAGMLITTGFGIAHLVGKKDKLYVILPPKADVPKGGIRVVIVNQAKCWNKAVRIYQDRHQIDQWTEVIAGDTTGKVAKANPKIKYDVKRAEFKQGKTMHLEIMKPAAFGIWEPVGGLEITPEQVKKYNGRTVYIYFDDGDDKFFEDQSHLLLMDKLA